MVERRDAYRVWGERRDADRVWWGKKPLGKLRRRWRIILKWIFGKWDESWTGLIWLRIGTGGGLL
jgi:hypothetical protein